MPDQRKSNGKLTIEERAKFCAKDGDVMDIFINHLDLGPKNHDENEIVASGSRQSQFRMKLVEAGINTEIINAYAKDKDLIQESNKIQKKRTKKRMAKAPRIPKHFSLANMHKRIQNMDISKTPTREDLADVIVMLSMRPSEVRSLQINHYEPDPLKIPKWYKEEYSWYCTGYRKSRGEKKKNPMPRPFLSIEKNPERAKELLTWIQDAIKAGKLRDPVFTESGTRNDTPFNKFLKQKPYKSLPGQLRDYEKRHASIIHGGKNPTPEYLKYLSRIALRQESDRLDAGDNYAIGDTESEDSDPESDCENRSSPVLKPQTSSPQPKNDDYNPFKSQIAKIDSMLAGF